MPAEFELEPHARGRGKVGEEAAVRWLRRQGYLVLERNVVTKAGEIDVVARDGETLVFLEIKARGSALYGPAIAAVGAAKQRRLSRAASLYLALRKLGGPCRFDVLGLDAADGAVPGGLDAAPGGRAEGAGAGDGGWRYTLVRDAFPYCG